MLYNKNTWKTGDLLTEEKMNNIEEGLESLYINFKKYSFLDIFENYEIDNTGNIECASTINQAINYALENNIGIVYLRKGVYLIENPIIIKNDITFIGSGQQTILKQKDNTEMEAVVIIESNFVDNEFVQDSYNACLKNIRIYGNKNNNINHSLEAPIETNNGLILKESHWSLVDNVTIENCGGNGVVFKGTMGSDWNKHCSTNRFNKVSVFKCSKNGLSIDGSANDNKFIDCQFGANNYHGVINAGGSNFFNSCTMWGSKNASGMYNGAPDTILSDCIFEGNAQSGLAMDGYSKNSSIDSCKFMSNSRETNNTYNHIYIEGSEEIPANNISIRNSKFLGSSSNADGDGITLYAIGINEYHNNINIENNSIFYNNENTVFDLSKEQIYGLKEGDILNGVMLIKSTNRPEINGLLLGSLFIEIDTGKLIYLNRVTWKWVELDMDSYFKNQGGSILGSIDMANYTGIKFMDKNVLYNHGNGNTSLSACGEDLILGHSDSEYGFETKRILLGKELYSKNSKLLVDEQGVFNLTDRIIDNLNSENPLDLLSANQGRILDQRLAALEEKINKLNIE